MEIDLRALSVTIPIAVCSLLLPRREMTCSYPTLSRLILNRHYVH